MCIKVEQLAFENGHFQSKYKAKFIFNLFQLIIYFCYERHLYLNQALT
jgi:hypothetical protein